MPSLPAILRAHRRHTLQVGLRSSDMALVDLEVRCVAAFGVPFSSGLMLSRGVGTSWTVESSWAAVKQAFGEDIRAVLRPPSSRAPHRLLSNRNEGASNSVYSSIHRAGTVEKKCKQH